MRLFYMLLFFSIFVKVNAQVVLSDSVKQLLLSEQNFYRKVVGAQALQWSDELEQNAAQIANNLESEPYDFNVTSNFGINIYKSAVYPDPKDAVGFWMSEQKYYTGQTITENNLLLFSHYTQIIWAKTQKMGCALSKTKGGTYILVCLYSPKGNIIGQKPLEKYK